MLSGDRPMEEAGGSKGAGLPGRAVRQQVDRRGKELKGDRSTWSCGQINRPTGEIRRLWGPVYLVVRSDNRLTGEASGLQGAGHIV